MNTTLCINYAYVLSHFSLVSLCANLWTVARQAPLSMGFSRQEYRDGSPSLPPGDLAHPRIKQASLLSNLHWQALLYHQHHLGSPIISLKMFKS